MDSWIIESGCPVVRLGRRRSRRGPKEVAGPRGNVVPRNSVGTHHPHEASILGKMAKFANDPKCCGMLWLIFTQQYTNPWVYDAGGSCIDDIVG